MTNTAIFTKKSQKQSSRKLHIIDIENIIGKADFTEADARRFKEIYWGHAVAVERFDDVILASSRLAATNSWWAFPQGIQRLIKDGPDGAELAVLEALDVSQAAQRYDEVVLASGDHLFADLVQDFQRRGVTVQLIIGRGTPARRLLELCPRKVWLKLDHDYQQHQALRRRQAQRLLPARLRLGGGRSLVSRPEAIVA